MVQARHTKIEIIVEGEEISKIFSIAVGGSGGNSVSVFRLGLVELEVVFVRLLVLLLLLVLEEVSILFLHYLSVLFES